MILLILHLPRHVIHACFDVQAARNIHKKDVATARIGEPTLPNTDGSLRNTHGSCVGIELDVLPNPRHQLRGIMLETRHLFRRKGFRFEELFEGLENHFIFHPRRKLVAFGLHVVVKNGHWHIAQVLIGEGIEQIECPLRLLSILLYESFDGSPVATSLYNIRYSIGDGEVFQRLCRWKRSHIGIAQRVFVGQTHGICSAQRLGNIGQKRLLLGRNNVQVLRLGHVLRIVSELDGELFIFTKRRFHIAKTPVFRCPHQHISFACREKSHALCIRIFRCGGVIFGIIIDFEIHFRVGYGLSLGCNHTESNLSRAAIVVDEVDFGEVIRAQHHFFGTIIVAKGTGVHEHCARGRGIKPTQIQHGFGLTSA